MIPGGGPPPPPPPPPPTPPQPPDPRSQWTSIACCRSPTCDTRTRRSPENAPNPRAACQRAPSAGALATPATTSPSASMASRVPKTGMPRTKLIVPSMGSTISLAPAVPGSSPCSSPNTPRPGWRSRASARAIASMALSTSETGLWSGFSSTWRRGDRKPRNASSSARSAISWSSASQRSGRMPARRFLDGRRLRRVALQPLAQRRLQLPGDRSGASAPHDTPVEARDGHDVVAGAGQEQLGHAGQVRDRDGLLDDGEPLLVGQLQDDLARDAWEDALRGGMGVERATDHREQVGARPLREDRVPDEDGLEGAGRDRLLLRQHVGEQLHGLQVAALPPQVRRRDRRSAACAHVVGHGEANRLQAHRGRRARWREVVRALRRPSGDLEVEERVPAHETAVAEQPVRDLGQRPPFRLEPRGRRDAKRLEAAPEPPQMATRFEQPSVPRPGDLVHAVTEQKAAVVHRHRGAVVVQVLAV